VLKDSLDVITSLRILQQFDTNSVKSGTDDKILIPNIKRSLVGLGKLLTAVLTRDASIVASSARVDVAGTLCNLLLSLFDSTLPLAPRHSILPHIMDELTMRIIRPIIKGFHSISVYEFTSRLGKTSRRSAIDIRPDILSILKQLIECLRTLKARTRELREFIIFETVKEIEDLWSIDADMQPTTLALERTHEHRLRKLARKDALWYHCSVLHAALDQLPPSTTSEATDQSLFSSTAVQILAGLIHKFESQIPVDVVASGMMLAVLEKAWLSGLHRPFDEGREPV
jgi:hypothetical protein